LAPDVRDEAVALLRGGLAAKNGRQDIFVKNQGTGRLSRRFGA